MPGHTSFYYAIFKKLQAVGRAQNAHVNADNDPAGNYGGFSLVNSNHVHGIFGTLGPNAEMEGLTPGVSKPLADNNNLAPQNPLWVILNATIGTDGSLPDHVPVPPGNQSWPAMPFPLNGSISLAPTYIEFNGGPGQRKLVDAVGAWISANKVNDTPHPAPVTFAALNQTPIPKFAYKAGDNQKPPILFVASFPGDDGRRHGDGGAQSPPLDHVPDNFWDTSQIFITDEGGMVQPADATLKSGTERYVTAIIGNAGGNVAGRFIGGLPHIEVRCDAQVFNTFTAPGVPLPSLGNLDAADPEPIYEQYRLFLAERDLAGFRFNVDAVFKGLAQAMAAAGFVSGSPQLGLLSIDEWLKMGHACVKVRITKGEPPNGYTPFGAVPTLNSNPRQDRHIAQRNIGQFDMTLMSAKKIQWKTFMVAQAGKGLNVLSLKHALPAAAANFYVGVPKQTFERWIAKGGSYRGFEQVRAPSSKPFPDAVILQASSAEPQLVVADHAKEPYLALSIGMEGDPARLKAARSSSVSMAHAAPDAMVVGGFTMKLVAGR
jgi:hypothetical protein